MLSKPTWLRGYTDCCAAFLSCIVAIVTARCICNVVKGSESIQENIARQDVRVIRCSGVVDVGEGVCVPSTK